MNNTFVKEFLMTGLAFTVLAIFLVAFVIIVPGK
jgi:hypothetical protein